MPGNIHTPDRLDRYMLQVLFGPLLLALLTLLLAQMLERLLRLMDLAAASGAALSSIMVMAGNLVPHYLGLALPAAFTAGMFMAAAKLGDDNELDVMLATGRSIFRVVMPYFGVALVLSVISLYLYGYLQPLSRYGYRAATHNALQAGWDARVEENRFVRSNRGFTMTADKVSGDGKELKGVFVQRQDAGTEEITTAPRGRLVQAPDGQRLLLELEDGFSVRLRENQKSSLLRFEHGLIHEDFSAAPPPFRARGNSVRELTLPELWKDLHDSDPVFKENRLAGEFHGRLARVFLLLLLPLLALPLGMAAKRGRRTPGVIFLCLALLAMQHSLQFGEGLVESGRAAVIPAVWGPFLLFAAASFWLFRSSLAYPGDNPVTRAVSAIESAVEGIGRRKQGGNKS